MRPLEAAKVEYYTAEGICLSNTSIRVDQDMTNDEVKDVVGLDVLEAIP